MTTLLLGLGGQYTAKALLGLAANINVAAALRFQRRPRGNRLPLPVAPSGPLATAANALQIPVLDVNGAEDIILRSLLETFRADVVVVACYPEKLPLEFIVQIPKGIFNIHPSLLPAFRGPTPVFWQLRAGVAVTGVSVHRVNASFDTGDLVAQQQVPMPSAESVTSIEAQLAYLGGELLGQRIATGRLEGQPQATEGASYQPAPGQDAFVITQDWTVAGAYRFMRATAEWRQPYQLALGEDRWPLGLAVAYLPGERVDTPIEQRGETLAIQLSDGVLITTG